MGTKYKTTDREQRANNYIVVGIGYCDIAEITRFLRPEAYTAGVYGWRADFYSVPGWYKVMISTGYGPLTFAMDKRAVKIGALIKKGLLSYNKRLKNSKTYCAAWDKCRRRVEARVAAIVEKAFKAVPYEQ